jgi:predicted 3-demethylubiquinone-9 3-methyltransferase (glyoxalase superfamily)
MVGESDCPPSSERSTATKEKEETQMQKKITTFLTFNDQAEAAIDFYAAIFDDSRVVSTTRYGEAGPGPKGSLMSATFALAGQEFVALNGGPSFAFSQGISLYVSCESQEEVDEYWEKLSDGGEKGPCGWLTDRFGVSWQIIPRALGEMLGDEDSERAARVMNAMLQMSKIDIEGLRRAYESEETAGTAASPPR